MAEDRVTAALRPSKKEIDARRIEIECVELPGGGEGGYIVTVCPKDKGNKPGERHKMSEGYLEPIKRVFEDEEDVLIYLKKVL